MSFVNVHVQRYVLLKRNRSTLLPLPLVLDSRMAPSSIMKVANKERDSLKTLYFGWGQCFRSCIIECLSV